MTRRLQCSHVKPGGAQCGRSAGEGGACRVHSAGYVAKARKPRTGLAALIAENEACEQAEAEFDALEESTASAGEERCEDATGAGKAGPPPEAADATPKPKRKPRAKPLRDLGVTAPPSSIEEAARAMGVARDYAECERKPWRDAAVRESVVRAAAALVAHDDVPAVVAPCRDAASGAALVLAERGVALYRAEWRELLEVARAAGAVDALIVDAPYSERTHAGHNGVTENVNARPGARDQFARRGLHYTAWTAADVDAFVDAWHPLCRGWFVTLTDDVLALAWRAALERSGRRAFQTVPCVMTGMTVRLTGDGPSSWAVSCIVARPRSKEWATWGTLPGAYTGPSQASGAGAIGGKPAWLMRALVRDYTRPGDLVCDPCAGAGTLGVACIAEGRRALLGDRDAAHVEIARKRLLSCPSEQRRLTLDCAPVPMTQASLLETGS